MFTRKPDANAGLNRVIDELESHLSEISPNSQDYVKMVDVLNKLYAMKKNNTPLRVSPDALVSAGAGLLGILIIIMYENRNVLTTKALSFVKLR